MSNFEHTEYVIYDTEFTAWEGSQARKWSEPWEEMELLQIGAVKVSLSDTGCEITESFNEFIKPVINPKLSEYITELTGITQALIDDNAVDLKSALSLFDQFCNNGRLMTLSWGNDHEILMRNAELQSLPSPSGLTKHIDLHPILLSIEGFDFKVVSGNLHKAVGVELSGNAHNALHDVRSIAVTLDWLIKNKRLKPEQIIA